MTRKSWTEKLRSGTMEPQCVVLDKPSSGLPAGARVLISSPVQIQSELKDLPRGVAMNIAAFRTRLGQHHGADGACAMTTSIFLRIAIEAALEGAGAEFEQQAEQGALLPFWRAVAPEDTLAAKLSCGVDFIR